MRINWQLSALILFISAFFVFPANDSYYYWTWSKNLQLSYLDGPPMIAYLLWISTHVFGNNFFAINIVSVLCTYFAHVGLNYMITLSGLICIILGQQLYSYIKITKVLLILFLLLSIVMIIGKSKISGKNEMENYQKYVISGMLHRPFFNANTRTDAIP